MLFSDCARHFQRIEGVSSRLAITHHLAELYADATAKEAAYVSYLVLGMIEPPYRAVPFAVAEKLMTAIVARALSITEDHVQTLNTHVGDLGTVIAEHGSWEISDELTVSDVYKALVTCAHLSGSGSQEERKHVLSTLLRSVPPHAAGYIVRIVLGKLRLGFSEMTIIDALSWYVTGTKQARSDIEQAYNKCADIGLIAQAIRAHGLDGLSDISITLGVPIRPAAAERLPDPQAIIERLGVCAAQPKFDGFRVQVHVQRHPQRVWMFSRNLLPMDDMFPDLHAALIQLLHENHRIESLIIEGEAMVYDENTQGYVPFQETVKRRRKHGVEEFAEQLPLKLLIFDVLWYNGRETMSLTEEERYKKLQSIIGTAVPQLLVSEQVIVSTAHELDAYFHEQITRGLEGVMVKRLDAVYQPGKRNYNWIKLKRHEEGSLDDTLDCVVLGYYRGRGKRASFGIGALLVGVYNSRVDRFETIAKIGTGLSDAQWKDMRRACDDRAVVHKPDNVVCEKVLYPDVWCDPSLVIIVRADELTQSPVHTAGRPSHVVSDEEAYGYALRFPRFMGVSHDKRETDATTVDEIKHLYKHQSHLRGKKRSK